MVAAFEAVAGDLLADSGDELRIRVGISTRPVVVGMVGGELRSEYTSLGDAVNVAARMQAPARPGSVLVTAETYRHVAPLVEALDLGPTTVKGKEEQVHAYEVVGLHSDVPGRIAFDAPLVGRAEELARLEEAFAAVLAGRGRTALLPGEPGSARAAWCGSCRRAARSSAGRCSGRMDGAYRSAAISPTT